MAGRVGGGGGGGVFASGFAPSSAWHFAGRTGRGDAGLAGSALVPSSVSVVETIKFGAIGTGVEGGDDSVEGAVTSVASVEAAARVSRSPERPRTGDETPELRGDEHAFGERVRSGDAGEEVLALRVVGVASWASRPCLCPFAGEQSDDKAKLVSLSRRANSAGAGKSRSVSSVNGDRV